MYLSHSDIVHISSFSHSVIKTEAYCDFRVPWNFITRGNTIMLHLVIRKFNVYSLQLFYSSFDSSWLTDVSTVLKMYKDDFGSFDVAKPYSPENTLVYEYYVMSRKDNYLKIHMTVNMISKSYLVIHDGPGPSSPLHNMRRGILCTNLNKGSIAAISNIRGNTVCMDNIYSRYEFIILYVEKFIFSGPNMMTYLSDPVYQYGGLLVYFNDGTNHYDFCESLHKYKIYTWANSLTFILVWFSGYSRGNLTTFLKISDCKPYYHELSTSINTLKKHNIHACRIQVCPALQQRNRRDFVFRLSQIGPADITLRRFNTLISCEPGYAETTLEHKSIIRFSAWAFDDWPLSVRSNINHTLHNVTTTVVKKIDNLVSAIIRLPLICKLDMTRVQMAVFLRQSKCNLFPDGEVRQMPVVNIPGLMFPCGKKIYEFTPTGKGPKNYVNFIYTDNSHINIGALINVIYSSCPIECRKIIDTVCT